MFGEVSKDRKSASVQLHAAKNRISVTQKFAESTSTFLYTTYSQTYPKTVQAKRVATNRRESWIISLNNDTIEAK